MSTEQLGSQALLLSGEDWLRGGDLGRLAPLHGARPRRRRPEEEEPLLLPLDREGQSLEERAGGVPAPEPVPSLELVRAQREEIPEHGERRRHAGEVGEDEEARHDAPPVGSDLARRDAEVRERLAEEAVQRDAHPGLQRLRVHADGPLGRR